MLTCQATGHQASCVVLPFQSEGKA